MSEPYGKTLEREWRDPEIRALSDRDYRILKYLESNEHRELGGIYYLAIPTAAHELGMRADDVELALFDRLSSFVLYDPRTEEVWVRQLAAINMDRAHDDPIPPPKPEKKGGDRRLPALQKSLRKVRSQFLLRAFLHHYAAWRDQVGIPIPPADDGLQLSLVRGFDAPSHAPSKGHPPPSGGASKPIAVSSEQVTDSSSTTVDSSNQPAAPIGSHKSEAGQLMPLVRKHFYVPDGRPPTGYDDGRDFGILAELLEKVSYDDLELAIEGLALMRDAGELTWCEPRMKLTVRALYRTHHGAMDTLTAGAQYFWRHHNQQRARSPGPESLGSLLAGYRR
jgi:hypothetical protein